LYKRDTTGAYIWIVTANQAQVEAIAVHEIGHALGLGHAPEGVKSVLHPAIDADAMAGHIWPDDLDAACAANFCQCRE
jgi:predicted Zn-dependent protease